MYLANFRIINNEFRNKYPDVGPEKSPLSILDSKPDLYMANNGEDTKHTRNIARIIIFVINGEELNVKN